MRFRFIPAAVLLGLLASSAPVLAAEQPQPLREPNSAASVRAPSPLDQQAIFRILCGGLMVEDSALTEHLWAMAGSLATQSWTPPKVTVRVVVSAPASR